MTDRVFLDTNVIVYAAITTGKDDFKRLRSLEIIRKGNIALSAQVLQEFFVTVVKKAHKGFTMQKALEWIDQLSEYPCQVVNQQLVRIAIEVSARFRVSYWDAAILSAARAAGCKILYSEDLNHQQVYDGVQVINPYAN